MSRQSPSCGYVATALLASLVACQLRTAAPTTATPNEPLPEPATTTRDGGPAPEAPPPSVPCSAQDACGPGACCVDGVCQSSGWKVLVREGPTARSGAATVHDPRRRLLYVHGGVSQDGRSWLADTWALDLASLRWRRLPTATPAGGGPTPRSLATLALDTTRDRLVLFGGRGGNVNAPEPLRDAWVLPLEPSPTWSPLPSFAGVYGHAAAYDPTGDRMLVSGGFTPNAGRPNNTLWVLDFSPEPRWRPPLDERHSLAGFERASHCAALDEEGGELLLFAGRRGTADPPGALGDLVAAPLREDRPTRVLAAACDGGEGCPGPRWDLACALDPAGRHLYALGGRDDHRAVRGELWRFDLADGRWRSLAPRPGTGGALVLDAPAGRLVTYGAAPYDASRQLAALPLTCP